MIPGLHKRTHRIGEAVHTEPRLESCLARHRSWLGREMQSYIGRLSGRSGGRPLSGDVG
jgi:hypothetical protein